MYDIILLIPSYDPDEKLIRTVEGMISAGFKRVVIVNDGSKKENLWPFEKLKLNNEVKVIGYDDNHGKGYALKYGFKYVLENYQDSFGVVTCDGDGQHLAGDCINAAETLKKRNELIFGCRNFKDKTVPFHNRAGNRISVFMYRFLCGIKLSDTQTGLRAIPFRYLKAFSEISGDRFEYETNTLLYMDEKNLPFSEISIATVYESDSNKGSHFNVIGDSAKIYKLIFAYGGPRLLKYIAGSLLASVIDLSIFTLLNWLIGLHENDFIAIIGSVFIATFVARVCSSLFNYFFNKRIFKSKNKRSIGKYYLLAVCQLSCSALLVLIISKIFGAAGLAQTLVKCIVDILLFVVSYIIQREWVFKE